MYCYTATYRSEVGLSSHTSRGLGVESSDSSDMDFQVFKVLGISANLSCLGLAAKDGSANETDRGVPVCDVLPRETLPSLVFSLDELKFRLSVNIEGKFITS